MPLKQNTKHSRQRENRSGSDDDAEIESRSLKSYIPPYLRPFVKPSHGDFCYTPMFHPTLIAQLMMEGFLPIASSDLLLPKLHVQRCVIQPLSNALHISKSVRKKSQRYCLTVNQTFDEVVSACRRQHGDHCWLYPPLVNAFHTIQEKTTGQGVGFPTSTIQGQTVYVRLYSIEVWNVETGALAAGELGYSVGSMYTSLTGFAAEDSAGSIQLAALGKLLAAHGFTVWDLGMEMDYKTALGSHIVPRDEFVRAVHTARQHSRIQLPSLESQQRLNCRDIINDSVSTSNVTTTAALSIQQKSPRKKSKPSP